MIDEAFINRTIQRGREAREKVLRNFSDLTVKQFNWKSSPDSWSIAECLEHLVISDRAYFSDLQKIMNGQYSMTFWEKYSPFTALLGKMFKDQLQEEPKRKTKTHRKLTPQLSKKNLEFIREYTANLDTFLNYISNCRHADIDETIITSPTIKIITYNLRDALQFLVEHEHRHINQGIRVRDNVNFPKG
jgi:uncharacterized damage-inducible protein DinB